MPPDCSVQQVERKKSEVPAVAPKQQRKNTHVLGIHGTEVRSKQFEFWGQCTRGTEQGKRESCCWDYRYKGTSTSASGKIRTKI